MTGTLCRYLALAVLAAVGVLAGPPAGVAVGQSKPKDESKPGKLELGGAQSRVEEFEKKVQRAHGQPFPLGYVEQEALRRVKALREKYPDDPDVEKLFERARAALIASKGETVAITPEMLAYRQNEKKLVAQFTETADKEFAALKAIIGKGQNQIAQPFPAPSHRDVDADDMVGKYVILEEFEYPANEFTAFTGQYVFVGGGTKGYYYVELSGRAWLGAYEALRRYRRLVHGEMPEEGKWTLVGRVTGLELLIPQAGQAKTATAQWGWSVEPVAIRVPGGTLATADPKSEAGGSFAGEAQAEAMKASTYSVTSVPNDVTPERLTEIYATAIKEKNYKLYLDCIDPDRRKTPTALSRIAYHWDLHQERFAKFYVHVTVGKAQIHVDKGFDPGAGGVEDYFLSDEEKAKIARHAETLVERAELKTKAWDERGRQYGSPKPRFLKRVDKKRWYITDFAQPF